jgi:SET domain-containing protein 6
MGSLILSRSFHVEEAEGEDGEQEGASQSNGDTSMASSSGGNNTIDDAQAEVNGQESDEDDGEDEDENENVSHVSLVPWADMLNARHGCDNARLFYEKDCLNMCSTRAITKGEQIVRRAIETRVYELNYTLTSGTFMGILLIQISCVVTGM